MGRRRKEGTWLPDKARNHSGVKVALSYAPSSRRITCLPPALAGRASPRTLGPAVGVAQDCVFWFSFYLLTGQWILLD